MIHSPLKICLVTSDLPATNGTNTQAFLLARLLIEQGEEVIIINYRFGDKRGLPCAFQAGEPVPEQVPVYDLPDRPYQAMRDLCAYYQLFFSLRSRYDVVIILGTLPGFSLLLPWLKIWGKKIVLLMTGLGINDPLTLAKTPYGYSKIQTLKLVDQFIGTSTALCQAYRKSSQPDSKLIQIPNGVDINRFKPVTHQQKQFLRKELALPPDELVFLYTGALRKEKGLDLLLSAWNQVHKELPQTRLLLVGALCPLCRSYKSANQHFIKMIKKNLGLYQTNNRIIILTDPTDNITVTGVQPQIERYYQAADLFIFPSRQEGMPNAVMEAMASGLPCITLDIAEIKGDLIQNENEGITVPVNDWQALAQAMKKLATNHNMREQIGLQARKKISRSFNSDLFVNRYQRLLQSIMQ